MELVMGLGVIAIFALLYVVGTYNGIVGAKNRVKRSWSDVLVHLQKKLKVLPALEEKLKEYKEYEGKTLTDIVKLRQMAESLSTSTIDPENVEKIEAEFKKVVSGLKVTVENYPDLKASELYKSTMKEIVEQQEDISAGITIYNRNVEDFNNRLTMFPSSIVNSMFNHEHLLESFNSSTLPVDSEIGFNPKI